MLLFSGALSLAGGILLSGGSEDVLLPELSLLLALCDVLLGGVLSLAGGVLLSAFALLSGGMLSLSVGGTLSLTGGGMLLLLAAANDVTGNAPQKMSMVSITATMRIMLFFIVMTIPFALLKAQNGMKLFCSP